MKHRIQTSLSENPTLTRLLREARSHVMTEDEFSEQRISFAYGNAAIDNQAITKDIVREADRRMRHGEK